MTRLAFDAGRRALVRVWSTVEGDAASDVLVVDASVPEDVVFDAVRTFTSLSRVFWRTYTHPASAALDDLSPNTEGWRREGEREALAEVGKILRHPNLPSGGMIVQSYVPTEEAAHALGRALHDAASPELTGAIVAEAEAEVRAIESAESGIFEGRSAQAVLLTRAEAAPGQVAAADELLNADPYGSSDLQARIDPTSAGVAAAYWLLCAAEVAAEASGDEVERIVLEADNIEALPVETPTAVLTRLVDEESPFDVVVDLVREAMEVAEGRVDPALLGGSARSGSDDDVRFCLLDPSRPGPDLVEDLLGGVHGAFLIWDEIAPDDELEPDENPLDDEGEAYYLKRREEFAGRVRERAQHRRGVLGLGY
jgi:hypothetical protein